MPDKIEIRLSTSKPFGACNDYWSKLDADQALTPDSDNDFNFCVKLRTLTRSNFGVLVVNNVSRSMDSIIEQLADISILTSS